MRKVRWAFKSHFLVGMLTYLHKDCILEVGCGAVDRPPPPRIHSLSSIHIFKINMNANFSNLSQPIISNYPQLQLSYPSQIELKWLWKREPPNSVCWAWSPFRERRALQRGHFLLRNFGLEVANLRLQSWNVIFETWSSSDDECLPIFRRKLFRK